LHSILLKTIGPKAVLETQLRGLPGLDRALIYGSWARRYHGEPGPLPQDVDLMVIGTADVAEIRAEADSATRKLGRDVNVTVLTPDEWDKSRPDSSHISSLSHSSSWTCCDDAAFGRNKLDHRTPHRAGTCRSRECTGAAEACRGEARRGAQDRSHRCRGRLRDRLRESQSPRTCSPPATGGGPSPARTRPSASTPKR
jgi:predicted nucleotidyltransferase